MSHTAIYNTHPTVTSINGDGDSAIAWDKDGNIVEINQELVAAEVIRLDEQYEADQQAAETAKASAHAKLAALGLTAEEIAALTGNK